MQRVGDKYPFTHWHEIQGDSGQLREVYRPLFQKMDEHSRGEIRVLDERLEATMREMGATFDISRERPWGRRPWFCDLLPQIFRPEEWAPLEAGFRQRLRAFELFLQDIYGKKEILRGGLLPVQPVLGSVFYQRAACGLKPPGDAYLHISGAAVCRLPNGELGIKHHYFSNASGISYMIQNRRALARVIPQTFQDFNVRPIADSPVDMLEMLRSFSADPEPTVVLLSSGPGSAVYSEHCFLARRMGIPVVQGSDLLVLDDAVYIKTVSGLEKVEVIYSRISDQWLDPMAFRRDSLLGVPGLVQCIRQGSVAVVNGIGSQLADDRALLPLAPAIIRYYLNENPILRGLSTFWMGDIDQREHVLSEIEEYTIRGLSGEKIYYGGDGRSPSRAETDAIRKAILQNPGAYVAQPQDCDALTVTYHDGRKVERRQDHILFALRKPDGEYDVFPGALTRVSTEDTPYTANELGGGSKDTWVLSHPDFIEPPESRAPVRETTMPPQSVTSRVAESFYWVGRYLERANSLAVMIGVIESLELEELNSTERTLYRPVWNRILPPLENPGAVSRRNISSPAGRYRLTLDLEEPDSVVRAVLRAVSNAESVLECISIEAWSVISALRNRFQRIRYRPRQTDEDLTTSTRKCCELVTRSAPEFFGTAQSTMLADGGWAFCEIGQYLERAIITGNAIRSIMRPIVRRATKVAADHETEIRLSAFLRLLNSRDIYRRVFQMRIEAAPVLELLWNNPVAPRSVTRCLEACVARLRDEVSPATNRTIIAMEQLIQLIRHTDWESLARDAENDLSAKNALLDKQAEFLDATLGLHHLISDGFLNHQIQMNPESQPTLFGHAV